MTERWRAWANRVHMRICKDCRGEDRRRWRCVVCGGATGPADTYLRVGDGSDPVHIGCRQ